MMLYFLFLHKQMSLITITVVDIIVVIIIITIMYALYLCIPKFMFSIPKLWLLKMIIMQTQVKSSAVNLSFPY